MTTTVVPAEAGTSLATDTPPSFLRRQEPRLSGLGCVIPAFAGHGLRDSCLRRNDGGGAGMREGARAQG